MNVLMTGSTGLIGSAIAARLRSGGDRVVRLVRPGARAGDDAIQWDPQGGTIDRQRLEGFDAAIHLAGENLAGIWTPAKKDRIRGSRVRGTRVLSEALASLDRPPRVLASASGIGFYGSRGAELLDESALPGDDFIARVCRDWEDATAPAASRGIRVVRMRTGVVLDRNGGALPLMRRVFLLGLGATIGSGEQYLSWITLDDLVTIYLGVIADDSFHGPVNATAPEPVRNRDFTRILGRVLRRPAPFRIPAAVIRLLPGGMADATALASQRAVPARLRAAGYGFAHPEIEGALDHLLR